MWVANHGLTHEKESQDMVKWSCKDLPKVFTILLFYSYTKYPNSLASRFQCCQSSKPNPESQSGGDPWDHFAERWWNLPGDRSFPKCVSSKPNIHRRELHLESSKQINKASTMVVARDKSMPEIWFPTRSITYLMAYISTYQERPLRLPRLSFWGWKQRQKLHRGSKSFAPWQLWS